VTVQSEDGKPLFANDMAAEFSEPTPELAPSGSEGPSTQLSAPTVTMTEDRVAGGGGERTLLKYCRPARIHDRAVLVTALSTTPSASRPRSSCRGAPISTT